MIFEDALGEGEVLGVVRGVRHVLVGCAAADGVGASIALTPTQARDAAAQLMRMADAVERLGMS